MDQVHDFPVLVFRIFVQAAHVANPRRQHVTIPQPVKTEADLCSLVLNTNCFCFSGDDSTDNQICSFTLKIPELNRNLKFLQLSEKNDSAITWISRSNYPRVGIPGFPSFSSDFNQSQV